LLSRTLFNFASFVFCDADLFIALFELIQLLIKLAFFLTVAVFEIFLFALKTLLLLSQGLFLALNVLLDSLSGLSFKIARFVLRRLVDARRFLFSPV
jgi:hypothetical protein